jgi:hypothetical protein
MIVTRLRFESQKTASNYRGTGKSMFWIQRRNNKNTDIDEIG